MPVVRPALFLREVGLYISFLFFITLVVSTALYVAFGRESVHFLLMEDGFVHLLRLPFAEEKIPIPIVRLDPDAFQSLSGGSASTASAVDACADSHTRTYLNRKDVQRALHVRKEWVGPWEECSQKLLSKSRRKLTSKETFSLCFGHRTNL